MFQSRVDVEIISSVAGFGTGLIGAPLRVHAEECMIRRSVPGRAKGWEVTVKVKSKRQFAFENARALGCPQQADVCMNACSTMRMRDGRSSIRYRRY